MLKAESTYRINHDTLPDRTLAIAMIRQALTDYHWAKELIERKGITEKRLASKRRKLSAHETERIYHGKNAYEWLMGEPLPRSPGPVRYTLGDCLEVLEDTRITKEIIRAARKDKRALALIPYVTSSTGVPD